MELKIQTNVRDSSWVLEQKSPSQLQTRIYFHCSVASGLMLPRVYYYRYWATLLQ